MMLKNDLLKHLLGDRALLHLNIMECKVKYVWKITKKAYTKWFKNLVKYLCITVQWDPPSHILPTQCGESPQGDHFVGNEIAFLVFSFCNDGTWIKEYNNFRINSCTQRKENSSTKLPHCKCKPIHTIWRQS